jgi:hypothetical protein
MVEVKEKHRKGWFRRVTINKRVYYMPISSYFAKHLPESEVFYGTLRQALTLEKLKIINKDS